MTKTKESKGELVTIDQQLSTLSPDDMKTLFRNPNSGMSNVEDSRTLPFPKEVSIVQKLTSDNLFENPDDNDRGVKGKLYIKPRKVKNAEGKYVYENKLSKTDLQDEMEFTLLKIEFGVEIWRKEKREGLDFPLTIVHSRSKNMIRSNERDAWIEAHNPDQDEMGYRYTNQVRLVMTPYSSAEVLEMAKRGDNPFVTISLSGTDGWNTWGVINEQMTKAKKAAGIKGALKEVLSSVFKITLSSVKTTSGSNEYYIFDAKVSLNDLQEALRFEDLVNSLDKEFTFFFNTQDQDPTLREVEISTGEVIDRTFGDDDVVDEEVIEEEVVEDIDDEDLPF
jgi:hypothetical protein